MVEPNPIILILEDCPTTALIIERAVMIGIPEVRVLWARTVTEAVARAEGLQVDLFIADIGLPDGNGFDFLWRMASEHPEARAIVMTASPLPEHEAHSEALGVLHFLKKPVHPPTLIEQLRAALDKPSDDAGNTDFRAALKNVTPADIVQLKCITGATTIVEFVTEEKVGRIRVENGEVFDATVGSLHGVEAVYEILGWKRGQVIEHRCVGFPKRTIDTPWQSLLMDAAHQVDERRAATA